MSLSKNVNRAITYVLVIMVIVTAAQLVVGAALGSSPVYVVVSKSMVPTLQVGDLVVTAPQSYSTIHVGQVIVFQEPTSQGTCPNPEGLTVVHRVVAVTASGLITQGDDRVTNPHPDEPSEWPPIPSECVKGVVVVAIPYLGLVSMLVPPPWNYVLVALILIFVFLSELRGGEEKGRRGGSRALSGSASFPRGPGPRGPGTSPPSPGP
ncbi:MAG: signal peptidase I [Nitrososphaerota archaeon]|nr:signal peptidase I [Nitrososphaerota archaeon]MDG6977900.1 signal peptidase I [Nitrososphaerota archaeon]MDG7022145.1 signal peptidase I [Nitrososphaerota archaeon]